MLIYSIFFSLFYETIENAIKTRIRHFKSFQTKRAIMTLLAVIFIVIILVSEVPLIQYEHSQTPLTAKSNEVPDYVLNMVHEIKPYSDNRVLVLPDNDTSMSYLDIGVSYYDVYGLPYGYQNFRSLFPNESRYLQIGQAFQNMNSSNVAKLMEAEDIGAIVVLNTGSNSTITVSGTSINGGGATFSKVLNNTSVYNSIIWNKNYAIYAFNASSQNYNYIYPLQNLTYSEVSNNENISVVTSQYSYESYPFDISVNKSEKSLTYDQVISLNRSNINGVNSNFSNIMFYYSNGTAIPAYIYNIENTTANIYLKITGEVNRTIDLRIYPYNKILFSSNGYIGEFAGKTKNLNALMYKQMPAVKIGSPEIFQAYMLGEQLQNPVFSNTTVYFTEFYNISSPSVGQWNINNVTLYGNTVSYSFTEPGKYNITYKIDGSNHTFVEYILPNSVSKNYNLTLESGTHKISPELNAKSVLYEWYVNGIYAGNNRTLSYNFKYAGSYSISVYELSSYGSTSEHFRITITKAHSITERDILILAYNLVIPVILVAFIVSKKFRDKIYRYLEKISKKLPHLL